MKKKIMKKNYSIWIIILIVIVWLSLIQIYVSNKEFINDNTLIKIENKKDVSINKFVNLYQNKEFEKIKVIDDRIMEWYEFLWTGKNTTFATLNKDFKEIKYNLYSSEKSESTSMKDLGISITWGIEIIMQKNEVSKIEGLFYDILPFIIFFIIFIALAKYILPKWWGMPFNTKVWKETNSILTKTRFSDIAWMEEVKDELSEIVDYLKNPSKYNKVWARHPKWVLLYGEPWSGKTLLARGVAGEANVAFFSVSWSEFMEMLVGMGAAKVRSLFTKAKQAGKAIIFIDEIDAIGKKRGNWQTWWHQEQEQTLNQILTEMDGFDNSTQIVVMAATNRPDTLDPALLRSWRFDRKIMVSSPTLEERIEIFNYYLKNKKIDKNINIESISKRTSGLVWADIENIVNEAALKIAKENRTKITNKDFEYALEKTIMWPEKRVKWLLEKEKEIITYHELGHAVTSYYLPETDQVEKISIVRRWHALWATRKTPKEDVYLYSKAKILHEVISLLWGRACEEVFFWKENITTWASNDFLRATKMIKDMIIKYWMDEDIWPINYENEWNEFIVNKPFSDHIAQVIDKKIKNYITTCYQKSKMIIKENKNQLKNIAKILIEKEYLNKEEFENLMKKK